MKTLLIIPDSDLEISSEVYDITSYTVSTVVTGKNITVRKLLDIVSNQSFECIVFASHMTIEDIYLQDSEWLSKNDLLLLCEMADCKLLFLNGCTSAHIANYVFLNSNTIKAVIHSTIINLLDNEAWKLPLTFFRILESFENDYERAFYSIQHNRNNAIYGIYTRE